MQRAITRLTTAPVDPPCPERMASVDDLLILVLARPWRRTAASNNTITDIREKLRHSVSARCPVEFAVPFGGYKGWRQNAFPHLDWAELFWIDYLRSYAERIAACHAPGVVISFSYTSGVMEWINNLPEGAQAAYMAGFERLLAIRSTPRLQLRTEDHAKEYGDPKAVLTMLRERFQKTCDPTAIDLQSAARNLMPQEIGNIPTAQQIEESARRCAAMMALEARRSFNKFGPRIQITHISGATLSVHLGSCRTAVAQPWVSTGYLQWRPDRSEFVEALATASASLDALLTCPVRHPLDRVSPALQHILIDPLERQL